MPEHTRTDTHYRPRVYVTTFAYLIATKSNSHSTLPTSPTSLLGGNQKIQSQTRTRTQTHFPFTVSQSSVVRRRRDTVARNEICGQRVLRVLIDCKYQDCRSP